MLRPKGFENPYKGSELVNTYKNLKSLNPENVFEAGANAMMDAVLRWLGENGYTRVADDFFIYHLEKEVAPQKRQE